MGVEVVTFGCRLNASESEAMRAEAAKACLREFLAHALAHNLRCVRIIHGKGKNSGPRGPVIKTAVNLVLRKTGPVLASTSARRVDGGTGAINVLLSISQG